jgi:serine/threonine protein kinase
MAPEVVKQTTYTKKADIWSVGCLVVEMLTGEHPWPNLTQMQAIFRVSLESGSSFYPLAVRKLDRRLMISTARLPRTDRDGSSTYEPVRHFPRGG